MAPSQQEIRSMFEPFSVQGQQAKVFDHVADNVVWTIKGHSPLSATYTSKQDFVDKTVKFLGEKVVTEPLRLKVTNVIGGGDSGDWAAVEMDAIDAKCRNGLDYNMAYCWLCKFKDGIIVEVHAYLCTKLLTDSIEQNA